MCGKTPDAVKENIKKKFQDEKLPMVDEAIALDTEIRRLKGSTDSLRANRNKLSKEIGKLMAQRKTEEAEAAKKAVTDQAEQLAAEEKLLAEAEEKLLKIMLVLPQMMAPTVPVGKDENDNVEREVFGEPKVPDFEIPYQTELLERYQGLDLDAARRVAGNGFYYLMGRYRAAALRRARLCPGLYDRQGVYLLYPAVYDPLRRRGRRNVVRGAQRHDV